jgi:hypothetical protein
MSIEAQVQRRDRIKVIKRRGGADEEEKEGRGRTDMSL